MGVALTNIPPGDSAQRFAAPHKWRGTWHADGARFGSARVAARNPDAVIGSLRKELVDRLWRGVVVGFAGFLQHSQCQPPPRVDICWWEGGSEGQFPQLRIHGIYGTPNVICPGARGLTMTTPT